MNVVPKLTERLCCMLHPYFTCEACKEVYCQMHLYSWIGAHDHPVPTNEETKENNAYWRCDVKGKYLNIDGTIV